MMTREQSIVLMNNLHFVVGNDVEFKSLAVEVQLKGLKESPCPLTQAVLRYFQQENEKIRMTSGRDLLGRDIFLRSLERLKDQAPFLFLKDPFKDNRLHVEVSKEFAKEMCDLLQEPFIQLRVHMDNGDFRVIDSSNPGTLVTEERFKLKDVLTDDESWRDVQPMNRRKSFFFPDAVDLDGLVCRLSLGWEVPGAKRVAKMCAHSFLGKLLEEESTMDLTIVAGNGAEVKCHKLIFTTHASAISTMTMLSSKTGTAEPRSWRVEMKENSEDGLRQVVRYIYGLGLAIRDMPSDLALELFQTAHKYGLFELETALVDLFLGKSVEWFTPAGIFKLYMFVRILKVFRKLREHSLRLLSRMPTQDLRGIDEFKKLSKAQSVDLMSKLVDYMQENPASSVKRRRDSTSSSSDDES